MEEPASLSALNASSASLTEMGNETGPEPITAEGEEGASVVGKESEIVRKFLEYVENVRSQNYARLAERDLNRAVQYPEESFYSTLDSKLKSCTGYIKKLRILTESQLDQLEKDFTGLNLARYVSEATQALAEAKLKTTDVPAALRMSTLFHRRYADFSGAMIDSWKRVLPQTKSDPINNPSKIRVDLRFLPEQILVGLLPAKPALTVLTSLLQALIDSDKEDRLMLPLISAFARSFALDFLGVAPRKMRLLAEETQQAIPSSSLIPPEVVSSLSNLISTYFGSLCRQLESENQRLRDLEKAHRRLLASRGDVPQERLDRYDNLTASFNKLRTAVQTLADVLDKDLPKLAPKEDDADEKMTIELLNVESGDGTGLGLAQIWNDEDERDFYENLPDLKATMPTMAYKDSLAESCDSAATSTDSEDALSVLDAVMQADLSTSTATATEPDSGVLSAQDEASSATEKTTEQESGKKESSDVAKRENKKKSPSPSPSGGFNLAKRTMGRGARGKGMIDLLDTLYEGDDLDGDDEPAVFVEDDLSMTSVTRQMLDAFVVNLQKLSSKDAADKMAVDFCTNLNRRSHRRRLVQALYNVPRTRADLLPLYSRLVAVLAPVMPDIATDLVEPLRRQFRWLVRRQDPLRLESKLRTIRFIAELTKFNLFPKAETMLCLKILLSKFKHHAVEMVCCLLESCGRYLYYSADSHSRMKILLEELQRRKGLQHFDARMDSMIENAYLACATPETAHRRTGGTRVMKERTPMELFIKKLFLEDLHQSDSNVLMSLVRRLPWDEAKVFEYGIKYLASAWKVNYACIPTLANILAGLANYQDDVAVRVVDAVLEDIRVQLELNQAKFNQRRLAMVRYLGEMYNYRIVDSHVIFNTLYSLVLFGWLNDIPTALDPPSHLLRLRLVCVLLSTCGEYFSHGSARRRLDTFLALFRRYFWQKKENPVWNETCPFPQQTHYLVEDTLNKLRRDYPMMRSFQEADEALQVLNQRAQEKVKLETEKISNAEGAKEVTAESESSSSDSESHSRLGSNVDLSASGEGDLDDEDKMQMEAAESGVALAEEEAPEPREVNPDDLDFMAVFDKLSTESYQTQASLKVPQFKTAIPGNVKELLHTPASAHNVTAADGEDNDFSTPSSIRVGLMTKKGQKQHHIRFMDVPEDADYVGLWKAAEEHERQERSEMVRLTLDMSKRQEREEYEEMMGGLGQNVRIVPARGRGITMVRPAAVHPRLGPGPGPGPGGFR